MTQVLQNREGINYSRPVYSGMLGSRQACAIHTLAIDGGQTNDVFIRPLEKFDHFGGLSADIHFSPIGSLLCIPPRGQSIHYLKEWTSKVVPRFTGQCYSYQFPIDTLRVRICSESALSLCMNIQCGSNMCGLSIVSVHLSMLWNLMSTSNTLTSRCVPQWALRAPGNCVCSFALSNHFEATLIPLVHINGAVVLCMVSVGVGGGGGVAVFETRYIGLSLTCVGILVFYTMDNYYDTPPDVCINYQFYGRLN